MYATICIRDDVMATIDKESFCISIIASVLLVKIKQIAFLAKSTKAAKLTMQCCSLSERMLVYYQIFSSRPSLTLFAEGHLAGS